MAASARFETILPLLWKIIPHCDPCARVTGHKALQPVIVIVFTSVDCVPFQSVVVDMDSTTVGVRTFVCAICTRVLVSVLDCHLHFPQVKCWLAITLHQPACEASSHASIWRYFTKRIYFSWLVNLLPQPACETSSNAGTWRYFT